MALIERECVNPREDAPGITSAQVREWADAIRTDNYYRSMMNGWGSEYTYNCASLLSREALEAVANAAGASIDVRYGDIETVYKAMAFGVEFVYIDGPHDGGEDVA